MRLGRPYDANLVDVWSVGATVWEIIEGSPPFLEIEDPREFGDRWPALRRATEFSVALHQFLRLCSELDDWRPRAAELLDVRLFVVRGLHMTGTDAFSLFLFLDAVHQGCMRSYRYRDTACRSPTP